MVNKYDNMRQTGLELTKILKTALDKKINQSQVESWSRAFWALSKKPGPQDNQDVFSMMLPPPNITGNLHLGHALTASVQDALIRQRSMAGQHTRWIPGFDHAGLATQGIVEKILMHKYHLTRQQAGRDKFMELASQWKDEKRAEMRTQLYRLGLDLDQDEEYFTMDEKSSHTVQAAFKKLYELGYIYRDVKNVYWSDELQSTIADIEVESSDGCNRYIRTGEMVVRRPISQWFVDMKTMAHKAVEVVDNGSIAMLPRNYRNTWHAWLIQNGVQDWCISRQSWWGHRIPAFKASNAEDIHCNWAIVDTAEQAARKLNYSGPIEQDPDVLDTWFSSSLLPLTIAGWPDEERFAKSQAEGLFPLTMMETGFDILTHWVSKMVMICMALEDKVPFELILLHGMICDSKGKKMSKSKGNVVDPIDVIEGSSLSQMHQRTQELHSKGVIDDQALEIALKTQKELFPKGIPECGADGLRAYLLSYDFKDEVVKIQIDQLTKVRRLSNKIWNIYRFIFRVLEESTLQICINEPICPSELDDSDRALLDKLANCVLHSEKTFNETYDLQQTFHALEELFIEHVSQDYIASHAVTMLGQDKKAAEHRLKILLKVVVDATKLLHPFMPHLTEYLYQKLVMTIGNELDDNYSVAQAKSLTSHASPVAAASGSR